MPDGLDRPDPDRVTTPGESRPDRATTPDDPHPDRVTTPDDLHPNQVATREDPDPDQVATREDLARELTLLRNTARKTIRELGKAVDVPYGTLGGWFRGANVPLASQAAVRLDWTPDALVVTVTDDGTSRRAADGRGNGLAGMRERVAAVGGTLVAGPGEEGGFAVVARLPYQKESL
ncbi:hypothetical protein AB0K48_37630 [Nonomuraea sp. NPDC055795]